MTRVSLLRCAGYSPRMLDEKLRESLSNMGFEPRQFKGARVAVKPNLLRSSAVESAVVTHPEFFRAAVRLVKAGGGTPVLVESPAFQGVEKVASKTGYDAVIREESLEVWDNRSTGVLHYGEGRTFRRFEIALPVFDADIILNLPKFKTHGLTHVTAAVKNLFGFFPGLAKSQWHMRARTPQEFSEFLLDFYEAVLKGFQKPKGMLHLIDAVVGMEGEGPGPGGTAREVGAVIAGTDAVAVDFVAVNLVGIDHRRVRTITEGHRRGLGCASFDGIELRGDGLDGFPEICFVPPRSSPISGPALWPINSNTIKNLFVQRPVPSPEKCTLCYQCERICPAGAIGKTSGRSKVPAYDYDRCIRCYCCLEICPEAAIYLKDGRLQWLIRSVTGLTSSRKAGSASARSGCAPRD